jgi:5-hydroxyisourate hydrolase
MSPITTHVLDTARGRPASGLPVRLEARAETGRWRTVGRGVTDGNGRIGDLLPDTGLRRGLYRLTFDTAAYFKALRLRCFHPTVVVEFEVGDPSQHYHVPLLLSPFGYTTYRGT